MSSIVGVVLGKSVMHRRASRRRYSSRGRASPTERGAVGGPAWLLAMAAGLCLAGCTPLPASKAPSMNDFVRREGDRLMDGSNEFRFISVNIPNLHYVEDDMRFSRSMPFRLPNDYEINDALETVGQMGGQVVRIYALPIRRADDSDDVPRYITGPGEFNEKAFVALDRVLVAARRHGVRLIVPFIDQWSWWGGQAELAAFRGKAAKNCWTDPELIDDYKQVIAFVINRRNTLTGVCYRDDPAILAWETGNELNAPASWTQQIAAFIKSIDRNHLVIDGATYDTLPKSRLEDPNVDFVQTHHYENNAPAMIDRIQRNCRAARGHRPYHVGEFGFLGTQSLRAVMDTVIEQRVTGALLWSLRYRSREGGFYWHHEPAGGDLFKAYHWPGFEAGEAYDERGMMRLLRAKAYEIRGLTPPAIPVPSSPCSVRADDGGMVSWRGSVGATCYDVQRAEWPLGPWLTVGSGISEAQVQYQPQFIDESACPGKTYRYRVIARNHAGCSGPSQAGSPVRISHRTLVDELRNDSQIFVKQGRLHFRQNEARKFKEDCHRLSADPDSAVIYHTHGCMSAVRLFVYSQAEPKDIQIAFSADCKEFKPVEPDVQRTTTFGERVYGFWKADLYTAKPKGNDCRFVKIVFKTDAQLGRVEVEYDAAH
ncbi:MAG TPA: hypothetical protein PLL20_01570 [Phycisphaerae bacterium]|nr:hypothetical protein [Phycisphaerae bacterium]HRR84434.1 hypothetical protein [Phycisphaerae bacterium]